MATPPPFKKILLVDTMHQAFKIHLESRGFECTEGYTMTREDLLANVHLYDGLAIRSRLKIDKEILDHAIHLKFIARAGAGMENIDVDYAQSINIQCLHAPEGNKDAVAEHALGMLLSLFNNLNRADAEVRKSIWIREGNRGIELMGKTVGIIGYGNMGMAFAQRLSGFGVQVLAYDKYKKDYSDAFALESDMQEIFDQTDVLSLHLPLSADTFDLVNNVFLNSFKNNIHIINTSRGKIVNTADLVENIKKGKVLGACLDVLEYESSSFESLAPSDFPEPFQYLINSSKVILSPHIAGWTQESNVKIAGVLAGKIVALY
jgi:D-3-phosphoglycerate dehydrogenase